eukprot:185434-Chlamydomonas_euryale.AAC.1
MQCRSRCKRLRCSVRSPTMRAAASAHSARASWRSSRGQCQRWAKCGLHRRVGNVRGGPSVGCTAGWAWPWTLPEVDGTEHPISDIFECGSTSREAGSLSFLGPAVGSVRLGSLAWTMTMAKALVWATTVLKAQAWAMTMCLECSHVRLMSHVCASLQRAMHHRNWDMHMVHVAVPSCSNAAIPF